MNVESVDYAAASDCSAPISETTGTEKRRLRDRFGEFLQALVRLLAILLPYILVLLWIANIAALVCAVTGWSPAIGEMIRPVAWILFLFAALGWMELMRKLLGIK